MAKPFVLEAGSHLHCILAEGDVVNARAGLVLLARASKRPGEEEWQQLYRDEGRPIERAGWWMLLNGGQTDARISIVRMGSGYAALQRAKRGKP
jgi:hypothetical protein